MKDLTVTELDSAAFVLQPQWKDDPAMTQQGFKKFRRRRGHRQDPVIEDASDLPEFSEPEQELAQPEIITQVPAPMPEPWEILRRVPIGGREHPMGGHQRGT